MKNILITGGSSGLGLEISLSYLKRGFKVFILDLKPPDVDLVKDYSNNVEFSFVDLSNYNNVISFISNNQHIISNVDHLVLNAAPRIFKELANFEMSEIINLINASFTSSTILLHQILQKMIGRTEGSIIIISSKSGLKGYSTGSIYCSMKSAWITFHESLIRELKKSSGVSINTICPDSFSTIAGDKLSGYEITLKKILKILEGIEKNNNSKLHFPVSTKTKMVLIFNYLQKILNIVK